MDVYVSETDYVVSSETIDSLQSQLRRLGRGVSRTVYDLGDGTVLKVCHNVDSFAGNNLSEWQTWQRVKGTEWEVHFSECVAVSDDGTWLIQRAIDSTFEDDSAGWSEWWDETGREISETLGIGDLHYGNVGTTVSGQVKVIDYAFSGHVDLSWLKVSRSEDECRCTLCVPCTCNLCDCERCNPNGCACDPFEGCREETCNVDGCYSDAVANVLSVAVCEDHNVDRKAWDLAHRNMIREVLGQGNLFGQNVYVYRSYDPD